MTDIADPHYLQLHQYKDATRLSARIQLHQRFSTNKYGWFRWVYDQFTLPAYVNILELGCGPGTLWSENNKQIPKGSSIFLTDFSEGMITQARSNLYGVYSKLYFETSNSMAIPFRSNAFDIVIANHMLYHVPALQKTFTEINRVLKPGGHLYATTNGENHLKELDQLMAHYFHFGDKSYSTSLSAGSFTLENGTQQLSPWFQEVNIRIYEDSLYVTKADPLLAYMLSMIPQSDLPDDKNFIHGILSSLHQELTQNGAYHIQKSIGMFICQK